jgi:hypothetical protein
MWCGALVVLLTSLSCSESPKKSESGTSSSDSLNGTGTLSAHLEGAAGDVSAIRFEIWRNDTLVIDRTVALETEPMPGELVGGAPSGAPFADALFVLPEGTYSVRAVPIAASGAPSTVCMPAQQDNVEVAAGKTNEIVILMACDDKPKGGLDVVGVLTSAPTIVDVILKPSKFVTTCEKLVLFAVVKSSEDTDINVSWQVLDAPEDASFKLLEFGPKAMFAAETSGNYLVRITATSGQGAETSLTIPVHVSAADTGNCLVSDTDNDGVPDPLDCCPLIYDPAQADSELDGEGDACDPCPGVFNAGTLVVGADPQFGATVGMPNGAFSSCGGQDASEVAYRLDTGEYTGGVILSTDGSGFDTVLSVQVGCSGQGQAFACNDDDESTHGLQSRLELAGTSGGTYVLVDGANGASGAYRLSARPLNAMAAPADCASAVTLVPGEVIATNLNAQTSSGGTTCFNSEGPATEFLIEVPTRSDVLIHSFGSGFDTVLALRKTCGDKTSEMFCNDNADFTKQSQLSIPALEAGTYSLHVASAYPFDGNTINKLVLSYQAFPVNKLRTCENPLDISKPGIYGGTTQFHPDRHEGFRCSMWHGPEAVHVLQIPSGGRNVLLDTQGSGFDTTLYVRKGDCAAEEQEVACNEDHGQQLQARLETFLDEGTYYVFVDGFENARGAYRLHVEVKGN